MPTTPAVPRLRVRSGRVPRELGRYRSIVTFTVVREGEPADRERMDNPDAAARWARSVIADDDREHFWVALLDSQNRLVASHHVSTGSLSASIVHPREVLKPALLVAAAHLLLAHNHPSGDPTPSKEDLHLTRQLVEGARLLGLRIHDHLIIGSGCPGFISLATRGLI
jgi:DNA repair protein RadC